MKYIKLEKDESSVKKQVQTLISDKLMEAKVTKNNGSQRNMTSDKSEGDIFKISC